MDRPRHNKPPVLTLGCANESVSSKFSTHAPPLPISPDTQPGSRPISNNNNNRGNYNNRSTGRGNGNGNYSNNNNNSNNVQSNNNNNVRILHCQRCGGIGHLQNACQAGSMETSNSNTADRPTRERLPTDRFGYSANMVLYSNENGKPEVENFEETSRGATHQNQRSCQEVLSYPRVNDSEE